MKAITSGPLDVRWTGTFYEFKTPTAEIAIDPFSDDAESKRDMLGAPRLQSASPTSFTCASCSLPLVQASKITDYRDLPSEHWAELVDAWMCHSDQKLNDQIAKHAQGFEPEPCKALVGGSYILFNVGNVVTSNLVHYEQSKVSTHAYSPFSILLFSSPFFLSLLLLLCFGRKEGRRRCSYRRSYALRTT
jgi:hypothetical protein